MADCRAHAEGENQAMAPKLPPLAVGDGVEGRRSDACSSRGASALFERRGGSFYVPVLYHDRPANALRRDAGYIGIGVLVVGRRSTTGG